MSYDGQGKLCPSIAQDFLPEIKLNSDSIFVSWHDVEIFTHNDFYVSKTNRIKSK